jgi:hypothetical protein
MSSTRSPRSWTRLSTAPAWPLAAIAAGLWLIAPPETGDMAAQRYRAALGLVVWDNGWYGGHHVPAYSVVFPLLAAVFGPLVVGAAGAVASAWCFERLVAGLPGGRFAAAWFAVATVTTLITGRLTFALGLAFGLAAVLAATRGRPAWACALGALTSLSSPVAGAFLALAAAAWWLDVRGWWPLGLGAAALLPAAALAVAFPEGGTFPFVASSFWPGLAAAVALAALLPRSPRVLKIGAALYAVAIVASFVLSTPMGGNVVRLGALVAGPLAAAVLWPRRPLALAAIALPLLYWQWFAPVDNWLRAAGDASTSGAYYRGVAAFLERRPPTRVEVPFTENHGEADFLAPHVPLARGWERQVDIDRNGLFYDGRPLTAARYRRWLDDNAVGYVALADAPLDASGVAEARLVRGGLPYLRQVYRDRHWRLFAVTRARPLARGVAAVTAIDTGSVRLRARGAGTVDLRVRYTPYWEIAQGRGCVSEGPGGWTRLRLDGPGTVLLRARFALGRVRATSPRCTR